MIVAGNWKMHKTLAELDQYYAELEPRLAGIEGVRVIVCPPFPLLREAARRSVEVYAQNVHWEEEGAFTGEVSARMLLDAGARGSIVGHSERRQWFGETDEAVASRARRALAAGLGVIACVGETEEERERGQTEAVLRRQVSVLAPHERLAIAYEPVWAIGTGRTATPELAQEAHAFIKSLIDAPVLYGGSVKPENAEELLAQPDVDGALVGGASLDPRAFADICRIAAKLAAQA